jgi:hypothetical protein
MTNHSIVDIKPDAQGRPNDIVEFMVIGDSAMANYDKGFYNIGVTTSETWRAGKAPIPQPAAISVLRGKPFPLSYTALAVLAVNNQLPPDVPGSSTGSTRKPIRCWDAKRSTATSRLPICVMCSTRVFPQRGFRDPRHVVEFYTRGGNFPNTNP